METTQEAVKLRKRSAIVLAVLLAPMALLAPQTQGETADQVVWWGPTGIDDGWHMRVLMDVTNPYDVPLLDAPVTAELDLGRLLVDAGWPAGSSSTQAVPDGFDLDTKSIRVVEMTNFNPERAGTSDGRLVVQDRSRQGDERFEVPRLVLEGLMGHADYNSALAQARPFDARTHPAVTVLFRAAGETGAGETRSFVVYFDSRVNGGQPPPAASPAADADLEALHWAGPGIRLYGHAADRGGAPGSVRVVGLHDDTEVQLRTFQGGSFAPVGDRVNLGAGEHKGLGLGGSSAQVFRVDADRPVVAYMQPVGFVPSIHGGFAGASFSFQAAPAEGGGNGVYLVNLNDGATKVRLESSGGQMTEVHLSDATNPLPYGGSRTCGNDGGTWVGLPSGSRELTARVVEGGPIMLQLQPLAMTQVPSVEGGPVGADFLAAAQWTTPNCQSGQGQRFYVVSESGPSTLRVESLETPVQVFPQGNPSNPTPPGQPLPEAPAYTGPFDLRPGDAENRDRPLLFEATGPVRLFAGGPAPTPQIPAIAGPLGGSEAGLNYAGFGEAVVLTPYANTHLDLRVQRTLSGVSTLERDRGQDDVVRISDDGSDRVIAFTVNASRPVFVYPTEADPGFLAGIPAYLETLPVRADFRGRLIALESASGITPMTGSVPPGGSVTYTMHVANLGRGIGGQDLTESIRLSVDPVPEGWAATLDRDALSVAAGQRETVHLTITAPESAPTGQAVIASVHAFSEADPDVGAVLDAVTSLQRTFGVGVWFSIQDGPKSLSQNVAAGGTASYDVIVQNRGGTRDTILLETTPPEPGWEALLVDQDGFAVDDTVLDPGETAEFVLSVTAPPQALDAVQFTTLTARSAQASSALDRVTALTMVREPSDVTLEVTDPVQVAPDGGEFRYELRLENTGQGVAEVELNARSSAPDDWSSPEIFLESASGQRVPGQDINLVAGEAVPVFINHAIPENTTAGTLAGVLVSASVAGSQETQEVLLTGIVAARHNVTVETDPPPPLTIGSGGRAEFTAQLTNNGNLNETLTVGASSLPSGWALEAPATMVVPKNGSASMSVRLQAPVGAPPGEHEVVIRLDSTDGHAGFHRLPVEVVPRLGGADFHAGTLPTYPGGRVDLVVPFHNSGNTPVLASLEQDDGEPWPLQGSGPVTVQPGANATLRGTWTVPREAADGLTGHKAILRVQDATGTLPPRSHVVQADVDVQQVDLRIDDATLRAGPGGTLVHATIHNDGTRDVRGVTVALLDAAGARHGDITVDVIPAGRSASVLLTASEALDSARLALDADDAVGESNEANNERLLDGSPDKATPLPAWILPLALAFGAIGRSRIIARAMKRQTSP